MVNKRKAARDTAQALTGIEATAKSRAAERASEANEGFNAAVSSARTAKPAPTSMPTAGQSFREAFRNARQSGDKEFRWNGKRYTTEFAGEKKPAPRASAPASKPAARTPASTARTTTPAPKGDRFSNAPNIGAKYAAPKPASAPMLSDVARRNEGLRSGFAGRPTPSRATDPRKARLEELRKAAEAPGASRYATDRYKYAKETGMVGNFKKGGPVMESSRKPIDVRRAVLGSDKEIVARGNRTPYEPVPKTGPDAPKRKPLGRAGAAGYKSGGSVMKKGADGIAKKGKTKGMMPKMACGGKGYAKGGSIDGIAKKGKTKGKMC